MQAAAEKNIPFIVLDRPNPLNGNTVQGDILEDGFESFVGITHIPQRYGLTSGELAQYMNTEDKIGCDLTVIKMSNWKRDMYYEDTGLTCWVLPSPNMPTVDTAEVYPGTCIFEGTNVSEGRGTTKPFEIIGAPWIDAQALADKMNSLGLNGVHFRATSFTPSASKFSGESCNGVEVHVTDRSVYDSVLSGMDRFSVERAALSLHCRKQFIRVGVVDHADERFPVFQKSDRNHRRPVGIDEIRRSVNRVDDKCISFFIGAFESILAVFFSDEIGFRKKFPEFSLEELLALLIIRRHEIRMRPCATASSCRITSSLTLSTASA